MIRIAICDDDNALYSQFEDIILSYSKSFTEEIAIKIFHIGREFVF